MSDDVKNNVPNGMKKRGRPRAFDHAGALAAATQVFWEKGFEGASLDDLTGAMGINRPSLYSAFGDKRRLFIDALNYYGTHEGAKPMLAFDAEPDITKAIEAFLSAALETQMGSGGEAYGCLLGTCAPTVAARVEGVAECLEDLGERTRHGLVERLDAEKAKGSLPPGFQSGHGADLLLDMMQCQAHRVRCGQNPDRLRAQIPMRARAVLGCRDAD
ncbi:MAG: TetR/AcrR family transcriptional regulator [Pseudomonadota bacterium]